MLHHVIRWWHTLEEPPQWTSAMCVIYAVWSLTGVLLAAGVTILPGAAAWVTWLLSGLLAVGGALASPATIYGARWAERIGNAFISLALLLGLVVLVVTDETWRHSWVGVSLALLLTAESLLALRLSHIVTTAYRPGSPGARSARGAMESRRRPRGPVRDAVGDIGGGVGGLPAAEDDRRVDP